MPNPMQGPEAKAYQRLGGLRTWSNREAALVQLANARRAQQDRFRNASERRAYYTTLALQGRQALARKRAQERAGS